jgi:hypothetical protein
MIIPLGVFEWDLEWGLYGIYIRIAEWGMEPHEPGRVPGGGAKHHTQTPYKFLKKLFHSFLSDTNPIKNPERFVSPNPI